MNFAGAGVSGPLPAALFRLPGLLSLSLASNGLSGTIPDGGGSSRRLMLGGALGGAGAMTALDLSGNTGLSGTVTRQKRIGGQSRVGMAVVCSHSAHLTQFARPAA